MNRFNSRAASYLLLAQCSLISLAYGQSVTELSIESTVNRAMAEFHVPGVTLAVVHNDEVVLSRGYGLRSIDGDGAVNSDTLFQIASVSKAFTAAALALLVDEGKLDWEDRIIDYLPEFRMYDPWVTREFTVRDLLTHRSGLPLGAGDLLFAPAGNTRIDEVIRALRFLKPSTSFRSQYDYDNLMYMVAGELVSTVSGVEFTDFVEQRIFQPLGMSDCKVGADHTRGMENRATPHLLIDGKLETTVFEEANFIAAAGGINCSAQGMTNWMKFWLARGQRLDSKPLISAQQMEQLWDPVTLMPTADIMKENAGSHMTAYALGWFVSSFYGQPLYYHSGGLWGMTTFLALLPEQNLAVFVSNNQLGSTPMAIAFDVLDQYLDGGRDWIGIYANAVSANRAEAESEVSAASSNRQADSRPSLELHDYTGTYRDDWYGDIQIEIQGDELFFRSARSPQLSGMLEHFQFDTFIARWTDRQLMADAYVSFGLSAEGRIERITMKAVSPATDFSYDFHDLDLRFVEVSQ